MRPELFQIPLLGLPIRGYGTLLVVGVFVGIWLAERRAAKAGLPSGTLWDFGIWALLAGIAGARLTAVAEEWEVVAARGYWHIFAIWDGGLTFYGGFIGAMVMTIFLIWRRGLGVNGMVRLMDLCAPGLAMGLAFGRLGCVMNGCCFGHPAPKWLPWPLSVVFPAGSPPHLHQLRGRALEGQSLEAAVAGGNFPPEPLYFTQLYEILLCLAIFAFIYFYLWPRRRFEGQAAAAFLFLYPLGRFLEEFLRGDTYRFWGALTISQIISLLVFAATVPLTVWFVRRSRAQRAAAGPARPDGNEHEPKDEPGRDGHEPKDG